MTHPGEGPVPVRKPAPKTQWDEQVFVGAAFLPRMALTRWHMLFSLVFGPRVVYRNFS